MKRDPEKAKAWRQRSKPLSQVSKKQAKKNRERAEVLKEHVHGKPCSVHWDEGCTDMAQTGHEPLLRSRGGDETDPEQILPICHHCHRMVHDHPKRATELGWMISAYAGQVVGGEQ